MSSNCDSDGCPVDHDGNKLEDGVFSSRASIAVRGDVFRELFSGAGQDFSGSHLDASPLEGSWVKPSALVGGIPIVERVEVEDLGEGYDSDEPLPPKSAAELCKNETSATIHAMLHSSKHERDALFAARQKLNDVLSFLRAQGFSEEQVLKAQVSDGFGAGIPSRDEFGLPPLKAKCDNSGVNPFVDKLKSKVSDSIHHKVLDDLSVPDTLPGKPSPFTAQVPSGTSKDEELKPSDSKPKLWSQVVKDTASPPVCVPLSYIPPSDGESVVTPPDEALKEGNAKLKCTIVGTFSKGIAPFPRVMEFANNVWKNKGLIHVGQKDNRTFIFRFANETAMNNALVRGTWYIDRKPLIVHSWGTNVNSVKEVPLWVRFDNVPDSYWTPDCLSRLASVVGPPICADVLTSKMEILPFAKICVKFTVGNDLPTSIPVTVLDPSSGNKCVETVLVSYPNQPLSCTACKSLGHLVGACPAVVRKWVRKIVDSPPASPAKNSSEHSGALISEDPAVSVKPVNDGNHVNGPVIKSPIQACAPDQDVGSDLSATPAKTFKNLKKVDEIDMKHAVNSSTDAEGFQLSRSQRKKLKKSKGKSPSSTS